MCRMKFLHGISRKVIVLGWVSFFNDVAAEMLYPLIPLFLTGTLGLPKEALGGIEGIADGIATGLRWLGGVFSDWSGKRQPFVLWGYALSTISKPLMGLAAFFAGWPIFLAGRCADRLGKSIRTAARDALIADATTSENRGIAFGLHRAMDTAGAVLGPCAAIAIVLYWRNANLAWLFLMALLPGIAATLLVAFLVRDEPRAPDHAAAKARTHFMQKYSRAFWLFLAATTVFSLGNSSDTLLIQRAVDVGLGQHASASSPDTSEKVFALAIYAFFNIFYAVLSTPVGHLSDRIPRKWVIAAGWVIYAGVYAGFAAGGPSWLPWILFAVYGVYQAFTDGVIKALVSDLVPKEKRAGAIGLYYSAAGAGQLVASLLTGMLWQHEGPLVAFGLSAVFAVAGAVILAAAGTREGVRA